MEVHDFEKLVSQITKNVLEQTTNPALATLSAKSCLIIIPNVVFGLEKYLAHIKEKYRGYDLIFSAEAELLKALELPGGKQISFDMKNSEFLSVLTNVETVLVVGPKLKYLQLIAQTDDSEDVNHIVLGRVMGGKNVHVLTSANGGVYEKAGLLFQSLEQMGIHVEVIRLGGKNGFENTALITERDVMKLKHSGVTVLRLNRNQRLTPLAQDRLREYKISIEYIEEGNR